ncbi:NAD(P)-dependent oxidoreductase [Billgrantia saliphila]|uniref:NAD(P)-dependent oxidoreductase n=1 Tax=Billgrantia saliphila TaxID=1848458 RepID=UPI000CE38B1B|nr:NAD(P)-binding oxidoreductase [Halomonas saliphila]
MTTLVVGASGATGRLLVAQLLERGQRVKVIVRSPEKLPNDLKSHPSLSIFHATLHELSEDDLVQHVGGCTAIASCLGHNLTLRGMYGPPRRLVADATQWLCEAARSARPPRPVKFVLMNSAGNPNPDLDEPISVGQRCAIGLVRVLLPPHVDNELAADYLRTQVGQRARAVEWVAVRPDSLIDADEVTAYEVHPSPTRSAVFNAGKTSRINVAHFMAELITNDATWNQWKGQMPVIYNEGYA